MTDFMKTGLLAPVLALLGISMAFAAGGTSGKSPATVEMTVTEGSLNRISLTPQAVARLGIETAPVERRTLARTRTLGGELISPPGQEVTVSAPVAGIVIAYGKQGIPSPGDNVKRGQAVVGLLPIDASGVAGAAETLAAKKAEFTAAQKRAERTEKLVERGGASPEELETARMQLAQARAAYTLAEAQRNLTRSGGKPNTDASDAAMAVSAPTNGVLGSVTVANGQTVSAGEQLFRIQNKDDLWVRVPVFAGTKNDFTGTEQVTVKSFSGEHVPAHAIRGPPSADPTAASIDLYFRLADPKGSFRSGERVLVTLPTTTPSESTVVPHSAIFRDIHGGTWVYENPSEHVFVRRRVSLAHTVDDLAVLVAGPPPGTEVVTVGVAELAGTEFGVAH